LQAGASYAVATKTKTPTPTATFTKTPTPLSTITPMECEGDNRADGYITNNIGLCIPEVNNKFWALNLNNNFERIDKVFAPQVGHSHTLQVPSTYAISGTLPQGSYTLRWYVPVPNGQKVTLVSSMVYCNSGSGVLTLQQAKFTDPNTFFSITGWSSIPVSTNPIIFDGPRISVGPRDSFRLLVSSGSITDLSFTFFMEYKIH